MQDQPALQDNCKVLDFVITGKVTILTMCDNVYQNALTFEMTNAIWSILPHLKREAKAIVLHLSLLYFHVGANPSCSQVLYVIWFMRDAPEEKQEDKSFSIVSRIAMSSSNSSSIDIP